ncbi:MAG TPA: metalloregulator ArsR/SmtB family transcription factor [Aggregatilineales bacterium]|jgi:ArsR family transcriptional regulator|nr:metalloregulator ArsR/SmtB family transcription factor [Aggregatilineales bacterium]
MPIPPFDEFVLLHNNICRAVNDPRRLQILYALAEHPRNVTSLAEAVEAPQPTVSRHLNVLRQRHLVTATRDGASVIYRLADARIIEVLETMRQVLRDSLDRQQTLVD